MSQQYNHWFWNSKAMNSVAQQAANFNAWLWSKQYKRNR